MKNFFIIFLAVILYIPINGFSQNKDYLESIVVTATRSEIPLDDTIVPVIVINRDQIKQSQAKDLSELIRFESGLDIGRNGGPGQATSLFFRGTESNHVLVLLDGVRINPGTIGGAALQHISPEIIQRVEIVKGARSALYGTDAIGGVINVITRKLSSNYIESTFGAGSNNYKKISVNGGTNFDSSEYGFTLNQEKTNGYKIRSDSNIKRGYNNLSINLFAKKTFTTSDITLRHWQANGKVEYLDFLLSPLDQDFLNKSSSMEINNILTESLSSKILLSYIKDDITQNQSDDFVVSQRHALDWQLNFRRSLHNLVLGMFLSNEDASSFSWGSGFKENTKTKAIFIFDSIDIEKQKFFIAGRYTNHETFGNKFTWNGEYAINLNEKLVLHVNLGHAFRAPDATDRFGYGGNINLKPEVSNEIQMGFRYRKIPSQIFHLELYENQIENLIEYNFSTNMMLNIGKAKIKGAQIGYRYSRENFSFKTNITYQNAINENTKSRLLRRPNKSFAIQVARKFSKSQLGFSILSNGRRKDFESTLPGYMVTNLTSQFYLGKDWKINVRIENVLDKNYETAEKYKMQGRGIFVELTNLWK